MVKLDIHCNSSVGQVSLKLVSKLDIKYLILNSHRNIFFHILLMPYSWCRGLTTVDPVVWDSWNKVYK